MTRRLLLACAAGALALSGPAFAEKVQIDTTANTVAIGSPTVTLLSNVSAATTGTAVPGIKRGSYVFECIATNWNSASVTLQRLGADGSTYVAQGTAITANGSIGVGLGDGSQVRAVVTGTPTALYCTLS